jgi:hypothetical protein
MPDLTVINRICRGQVFLKGVFFLPDIKYSK